IYSKLISLIVSKNVCKEMNVMNLSNTAKVIKESETRKLLTSKGNQEIKEKIRKASHLMFQRNEKAYRDLENR
ncbi:hypothetical protein, partial [Megasphaera sp.]|uniref:hypothetical protein n=1 Tax=Megasphaera sp. TaxID=2023260 RepID=UPI003FD82168